MSIKIDACMKSVWLTYLTVKPINEKYLHHAHYIQLHVYSVIQYFSKNEAHLTF